jgi:hypothetical protein
LIQDFKFHDEIHDGEQHHAPEEDELISDDEELKKQDTCNNQSIKRFSFVENNQGLQQSSITSRIVFKEKMY